MILLPRQRADIGAQTQGCISLPYGDPIRVLTWLNPARHPVVVIGPASVVRSYCRTPGTPAPFALPPLLLDYDVVNFPHLVDLDTGDVRLHIVVEPVLEVVPALPYL